MSVLENKMDEIKSKLNKIADDIVDIKVILAKQETTLETHIKRSDQLEEHFDLLQNEFKQIHEKHIKIDGIVKFIGFLGIIASVLKTWSLFWK